MTVDHHYRRRGGMYVAVLGSTMIITVIGLSALAAMRISRRAGQGSDNLAAARFHAHSAIEMGRWMIHNDPNWRTSLTNGFWRVDQPIGRGTYTLEGIDPSDGNLSNNDTDSLLLTGIGIKGESRYKLQVTLTPQFQGLSCLEVALDAGVDLTFSWMTLTCDQSVSANGSIIATNASGASDLEAVGTINPGGIVGTQTSLSNPRTLPDSAVFDFYTDTANGTAIDINAIPKQGGIATIQRVVISPASNPYPPYNTNGQGIYIINCAGQDIYITESRIVGTLVLLNPGPLSDIYFSLNWEPAVPNYPALLVSGNMPISLSSAPLWESNATGSFNPPGTPYEDSEDTNTTQSYPSVIKGLVYVSGAVDIINSTTFDGVVVVGGSLVADGNLTLTYQPTFLNNPPPGFSEPPKMVVYPGSWKRTMN